MPYRPKSPQEHPDGAATSGEETAIPQPDAPSASPEEPPTAPGVPTKARKTLWLVGIGIGLYFIATGIYQAITAGHS